MDKSAFSIPSDWLADLKTFVSFPTVSAKAQQHGGDLQQCATWLAKHLQRIGLENVQLLPATAPPPDSLGTGQYPPIVYADWLHAGQNAPTVLIYGHYDVQPAEPFAAWQSPPFEPMVRGAYLYGRGASDDKGQLFAHLKALETALQTNGKLPVNVRCLFEGSEEVGSPFMADFLRKNKQKLAVDVALVSDTAMLNARTPVLMYGLRGALYVELTIKHAVTDLHSGNFGGAFANPLEVLCQLIARFWQADGRIAVEGFYDDIAPLSTFEQHNITQNASKVGHILRGPLFQKTKAGGERAYSIYERVAVRPSLTVCGVQGGYSGSGLKAVVPSSAMAKLDFRLVPNQNPDVVFDQLTRWVRRQLPVHFEVSLKKMMAQPAVVTSLRHPAVRAASAAMYTAFGVKPLLLRSGGTVPIVQLLQKQLGIPTILMGFGLPDDNIHAPNERFYLPHFPRAVRASGLFLNGIVTG